MSLSRIRLRKRTELRNAIKSPFGRKRREDEKRSENYEKRTEDNNMGTNLIS
ncbi:MAG: hypothetical protein ACTS6G_02640 [Candidatus Hodgkinia cicadicola]